MPSKRNASERSCRPWEPLQRFGCFAISSWLRGGKRMADPIAQFARATTLNLETFRKSGVGGRTPVWFVQDVCQSNPTTTVFYVYSELEAGKVKRVLNNPMTRIAPCNFRGTVTGEWIEARARICAEGDAAHGQELLRRKYALKRIGDLFGKLMRHRNVVIAIDVD